MLTVPASGGVYGVGANPTFPTQVYDASSYWTIDVVFAPEVLLTTLFPPSSTPANPPIGAGAQYEIGVTFTADVAGVVTQLRFYKGAGNTGTHVGNLYDGAGDLLATVTYTGETPSGWQSVSLGSPVALTAGATYVASVVTTGGFSYDVGYFGSSDDSPPLHVPASGGAVFSVGAGFPDLHVYQSDNYWVDVVFQHNFCTASCTGVACGGSDGCGGTCCSGSGCNSASCGECAQVDSCGGTCIPLADNTSCSLGTCQAGVCTSQPPQYSVFDDQGSPGRALGLRILRTGLGMRFHLRRRPASVVKIRFDKPASASGTHTGNLWDGSGNLLATVAFLRTRPASGRQEATLATAPVAIAASTPYVSCPARRRGTSKLHRGLLRRRQGRAPAPRARGRRHLRHPRDVPLVHLRQLELLGRRGRRGRVFERWRRRSAARSVSRRPGSSSTSRPPASIAGETPPPRRFSRASPGPARPPPIFS